MQQGCNRDATRWRRITVSVRLANGSRQGYKFLQTKSMRKDVIMQTHARLWLTLACLLIAAPILSGCNTARGVGEDVSAAGRGIERTADKVSGSK